MLSGDFCVTLFGSNGRWRQENLSKGDVGYIPQGFGHSIENIGRDKGRILIVSIMGITRPSIYRNGSLAIPSTS